MISIRRTAFEFVLFVCLAAGRPSTGSATVDPRAWTELDIVPMPKEIRLTDNDLILDPERVVVVIGDEASRQSEIGAGWINRRAAEFGGTVPLPVVTGAELPANKTTLIIGTVDDNPLIAEAVQAGLVAVGPGNPGERGYEIRRSADGRTIYLAGADPLGALYACVTFGELLDQRGDKAVWRAAEVRDAPDLVRMLMGQQFPGTTADPELCRLYRTVLNSVWNNTDPGEAVREQYIEALQDKTDWMLRRKMTLLHYENLTLRGRPFQDGPGYAILREGMDYGRERGVGGQVHSETPFVALAARYPDAAQSGMGLQDTGPHAHYGVWIRCWSMDDLRRKTARELAQHIQALGLSEVNFHDTDTGWYTNPAQWNERCEACRERWGDDYAAATIHKHGIYVEEILELNPDVRIHLCLYPYNISILTPDGAEQAFIGRFGDSPAVRAMAAEYHEHYQEFWRRMHAGFPLESVTFAIREQYAPAVQALRELMPERGLLVGFALMSHAWRPLFSEAARWAGTFVDNPRDVFGWTAYLDGPMGVVPLEALAVREYTWNTAAPGAAPWDRLPPAEQWRHGESQGTIFEVILPRMARNLFGREAAPFVAEAVSRNVELQQIFDHQRRQFTWLKDYESMQAQADRAMAGAQALNELWARCRERGGTPGMDAYALRRFIVLREQLNMAAGVARIRAQNFLAREAAIRQDMDAAEEAIAAGLRYLSEAVETRDRLLAERPDDPVLGGRDATAWHGRWRKYTADRFTRREERADFTPYESILRQTGEELASLGTLGMLPDHIAQALVTDRMVRAHRVTDGFDPEEDSADAWDRAMPVETFLVFRSSQPARAHTRARMLYDDHRLYLKIDAWVPGDSDISGNDMVEVFLQPPALQGDYVHFFLQADGSLRQQYNRMERLAGDARTWQADNDWTLPGVRYRVRHENGSWQALLTLPLDALGGPPAEREWLVNLTRSCPLAGETEHSSILPPDARNFHDVAAYRRIVWSRKPYPGMTARIEAPEFRVARMTLPDAIASVATFRLEIESDRVLHEVRLEVEAYDAEGRLQVRQTLEEAERVFYRWVSPGEYVVEYRDVHARGGLRIRLTSREGEAERWIRFGGWEGAPEAGSLLTSGPDGSRGLAGMVSFADRVQAGEAVIPLLEGPAGTLEFELAPSWTGRWLPPRSRHEIRTGRHVLVHYGPHRPDAPTAINNAPLTLLHDAVGGILTASLLGSNYAGWTASAVIRGDDTWQAGAWQHVALVWDAAAPEVDRLRLYVGGRRVSGATGKTNPRRLPDEPESLLSNDRPFPIHIWGMNSGWRPAHARIRNLRFSRSVRYDEDFDPPEAPGLDRDTTALFPFDETLAGRGMTPEGNPYEIPARGGIAAH